MKVIIINSATKKCTYRIFRVFIGLSLAIILVAFSNTLLAQSTVTLQPSGGNEEQLSVDHYQCYESKLARKCPKFQPFNVILTDSYSSTLTSVTKPESICNPADKNDEGISDDLTHLMAYQIANAKVCSDNGAPCKYRWDCKWKASCVAPKVSSQMNILVKNQLGTLLVDTLNPTRLLVPSAKSIDGLANPDDLTESTVGNYRCYSIKVKRNLCEADPSIKCRSDSDCGEFGPCNLGFPCNVTVNVADQFTKSAKSFKLSSPVRLCLPVNIGREEIRLSDSKVLCYPAKTVKGEPSHIPIKGASVVNQFGNLILDTIKEEELCVPNDTVKSSRITYRAGYYWVKANYPAAKFDAPDGHTVHQSVCAEFGLVATDPIVSVTWDMTLLNQLASDFGYTPVTGTSCCSPSLWCWDGDGGPHTTAGQCETHSDPFPNTVYFNYGSYSEYEIGTQDPDERPVFTCLEPTP